MQLIFQKEHSNHFRELDVKNLNKELGSKSNNVTTVTFDYTAAINGRFERKLSAFIGRLPFAYFTVHFAGAKMPLEYLKTANGLPVAKRIKHLLVAGQKLNSLSHK